MTNKSNSSNNLFIYKLLGKKDELLYEGKRILLTSDIVRSKFYEFQKLRNPLFRAVEIETTSICNRKCTYCPNSSIRRPAGHMDDTLFYKIIDQLSEIDFSGRFSPHFYGEPLLDKRMVDFILYTRRKLPRVFIKLFTNGDLLTIELFEKLIEAGVDVYRISQHGEHPSRQLSETLNKIDNETKRKRIEYNKYWGNEEIKLMNRGGLVDCGQNNSMSFCEQVLDLIIDFEGNLLLCCQDFLAKNKFGNLKNDKILDVWRKNEFKKVRDKILCGYWPLKICEICTGA